MLKNANLLAKIAADTAENEQDVAEVLTICPGRELPRGPELAGGGEGCEGCSGGQAARGCGELHFSLFFSERTLRVDFRYLDLRSTVDGGVADLGIGGYLAGA